MPISTIWISFGLVKIGENPNRPELFKLANYNYDVGLQIGEKVHVHAINDRELDSGSDYLPPEL
jgi:hypothetical protein